jgi:hypothetical protein
LKRNKKERKGEERKGEERKREERANFSSLEGREIGKRD